MATVTICNDFGAQGNKVSHYFHCFPVYLSWSDRTRFMIFVYEYCFKPAFSLFSFTFIKRLCSSSLLSAMRVISSAYLKLLIFLPAILIPSHATSSPAYCVMKSSYNLNNQGDNIQPWCPPFPIWNQVNISKLIS